MPLLRSFILLFCTCIALLSSCTGKRERMLCRTWIVSEVRFTNIEQALVHTDTISGGEIETRKRLIAEMLMKNLYTFRDDGTYITGNAAASAEGKWKLKSSGIQFISNNKNIKPKLFEVVHLSEDSLVLNLEKDNTSLAVALVLLPAE